MDEINSPPHYQKKIEPIDVIEAWGLGFHLGNAVKYIARWDQKGGIKDLRKCEWYIKRFIREMEAEQKKENA